MNPLLFTDPMANLCEHEILEKQGISW